MPTLVIVESPAKARTISKFLGSNYIVKASMGHVRDLPKSKIGVDIEHGFTPDYGISKDKGKVVKELMADAKRAELVILATDEDREGEAIAWHLAEALKLGSKPTQRIAFHEITKSAIEAALQHPREIDYRMVDAQQARRVLDRLVGYELSPLLWKKVRYGLSAGRVQSVALRLVVDREREIQAFNSEEYWSIAAELVTPRGDHFTAELSKIADKKAVVPNRGSAEKIEFDIKDAAWRIGSVEQKSQKRTPPAPFTTSTLQQEAARKLGFSVKKTMQVAQMLYEGHFGEGLITYMRTDSVNLAKSAVESARAVIASRYGADYVPATPRVYKTKSKGAQEAHEAIRPTDPRRAPETLAGTLDRDALRLYELIWRRLIACQMAEAVLDQTGVDVLVKDYTFRATGQVVRFPGFFAVYTEGRDEEDTTDDDEKMLPVINADEITALEQVTSEQHFTKPPARYTEASLVKKLESEGIGRPSTYAPTISTVITRGYIEKDGKALKPTDTGMVVTDFLVAHFANIVDYKFTAKMEEEFDEIAEGNLKWQDVMTSFYGPFHTNILEKEGVEKATVTAEPTDIDCELCGHKMVIKLGRFGKFLSCGNFPDCKAMKPLPVELGGKPEPELDEYAKAMLEKPCPDCGSKLEIKRGRFGPFVGCSKYPDCKYIAKLRKDTGVVCDICGKGTFLERIQKKTGKPFWGCSGYPKCRRVVNEDPRVVPPADQPQKESKWAKKPAAEGEEKPKKAVKKAVKKKAPLRRTAAKKKA